MSEKFYAVVHKEGSQWIIHFISSVRGSLDSRSLGPYLKTKKDVKEWFKECQNYHEYEEYTLCFG